jgi:DNA-binding MarR family transcriptional regulator
MRATAMKRRSPQTRPAAPAREALADAAPPAAPMTRRLIAARLIALMKLLHRSASRVYRTETRLSDFEWRVLTQVGSHEPISLTALATLLHQDKGQVSHAAKGLAQAGFVSREHLRAPIVLTKTGRSTYARVLRIGRARNRTLMRDLTPTERALLPALLARLQVNAQSLLKRENVARARATRGEADEGVVVPVSRTRRSAPAARGRLLAQDLFALHSLLQRSAASAYKRKTGLSDFEWRVLAQLAELAPITLIEFMPLLSRDKSQVGRTLARLADRELIIRETIGAGRHIRLDISARGREVYSQLADVALERHDALVTGLRAEEQRALMAIFDKLTNAANALLARTQLP